MNFVRSFGPATGNERDATACHVADPPRAEKRPSSAGASERPAKRTVREIIDAMSAESRRHPIAQLYDELRDDFSYERLPDHGSWVGDWGLPSRSQLLCNAR